MTPSGPGPVAVIETERLVLRRFTPDDLAQLTALHGDVKVMRYLTGRVATAEETRERTLPGYLAEYVRHQGLGHWAATDRATNAFIGWFALVPVEGQPATLELGYRLCHAAWGCGYATEGAQAVLELAFGRFGAERVTAQTMAVNARSRAVMERLGMRLVRTFHGQWPDAIEGSEQGDVEYAIERTERVS